MKFLVRNYSCLQNPWLGGYRPQIPVLCPPLNKIPGYTIGLYSAPSRPQWPLGLNRRSAASRLLRLWVRIPPGARMSVYCECCMLSGRSLCDGLITRPEESYRLWCVVVCDLETS